MPLLPLPEPYDFALSTERFRAYGPDFANVWADGALHRVVGGREVRIEAAPGGVLVEPLDAETEPVVRRLLGAEFHLDEFRHFALGGDSVLAELVPRLQGFRPPLVPDPFEMLVSSIAAQQVSLHAAIAIRNRLIERHGVRAGLAHAFPAREALAGASVDELRVLGFSERKAEYVLEVARADVDYDALAGLPDAEVKERIVALRGLGEWTADWFLARHLGRPTAWPASDLGIRKAVAAFYRDGHDVSIEEVRAIGARFSPFQNLTAHYLLTGLRVARP